MGYFLSPQAEADIEAQAEYVAERNPRAATELVEALHRRFALLAEQPRAGMARPDIRPDLRHVVVGNLLALYRLRDGDVEIVRVLHGRRNITPDIAG